MDWADLESTLRPVPDFYVEAPDGRKDWAEIDRQATLRKLLAVSGGYYADNENGRAAPATQGRSSTIVASNGSTAMRTPKFVQPFATPDASTAR